MDFKYVEKFLDIEEMWDLDDTLLLKFHDVYRSVYDVYTHTNEAVLDCHIKTCRFLLTPHELFDNFSIANSFKVRDTTAIEEAIYKIRLATVAATSLTMAETKPDEDE